MCSWGSSAGIAVDVAHAGLRRANAERGCGFAGTQSGRGDVGTHASMGSVVSGVMSALSQMGLETRQERIAELVTECPDAGEDGGGCR
jgi:DNA invertase Pin-like site-specific DNA recombinase